MIEHGAKLTLHACSACAGPYEDPTRGLPTAEDLDAVAEEERVKEATDQKGEKPNGNN